MTFAAAIIDQAAEELGSFLPRLGGALALLVIGLLAARLIGWLLRRMLDAAGVDRLGERLGIHDALARATLPRSLSTVVSRFVRIAITLVVIFAALSLLGLQFLSDSLNAAVLFLPSLAAAAALLLAGVVIGGWVRERLDRLTDQVDLPVPLGQLGQIAVVAIFIITAAAQIAVSSAILLLLVAVLLAAAAGTFALAFGLGGREMARSLNAGRFVTAAFELGQEVSVGGFRGRIVALEPAATVLETEDGRVRLPNHMLTESPVIVHGQAGS